jgi:hypothetical protein
MQINNGGESWSVTSKWTGNPETVKGFPRMKAHPSNLPVRFWNVSNVDFRAEFNTYVKGTENDSPEEQAAAMHETYVRSNAALDVFLSDDALNSTLVGPPIEIMIWYVGSSVVFFEARAPPPYGAVWFWRDTLGMAFKSTVLASN